MRRWKQNRSAWRMPMSWVVWRVSWKRPWTPRGLRRHRRSSAVCCASIRRSANGRSCSMPLSRGRLGANLSPLPSPRVSGAETVTFEVELNPGMGRRALARVASGGELSRLMLALKVVLAEHDAVPTLVFDEVDQGIGGEVGGRVGEALAAVTRDEQRQALVITHLPQIAAYARHQLVVAKGARGGVATSDVRTVAGETRTRELARMLGDADMESALGHAAELGRKASATSAGPGERPSRAGRRRPP